MLRYQTNGLRRDMGLGAYPAVSLADARELAADARRTIARGGDPIAARRAFAKATRPAPTFGEVAAAVIEAAKAKSANSKVRYQWERHLGPAYCGPLLGRPVHEITTMDIVQVLRPVWTTKPEVARKLYPAIRRVFEHARIRLRDEHGIVMVENPAKWADLKALGFEAPPKLSRGHHPSLAYADLPAFMKALRAREGVAGRALEFLILTNVRTDAVLKCRWDEVDFEAAIWTVPLANLKDRKHRREGFRVPLSEAALNVLRPLWAARASTWIYPGQSSEKPLSNTALLMLIRRMTDAGEGPWTDPVSNRRITAHGFRATFRTWAEEATGFPHAVIEEAMGHQVGNSVERAYRRTDVIEQRRELMRSWSDQCARKQGRI